MSFFDELNPFHLMLVKNRDIIGDLKIYFYLLLFLILCYNLLIFLVDKIIRVNEGSVIYNRRRIIRYLFILTAIFGSIPIFYERIAYLPTILAFTGAGFVISTKDITLNFVGWILIHSRNGFAIGDRVEINHIKGEVVNIGVMRFTLLEVSDSFQSGQSTNRLIHIPNHHTIIHPFFVISSEMNIIWDEIYIHLKNSSDWKIAKKICSEILDKVHAKNKLEEDLNEDLKEVSKNFLIKLGKKTPIVYLSIEESKILLSLRYLTHVHRRRQNRDLISTEILTRFQQEKKIQLYSLGQ